MENAPLENLFRLGVLRASAKWIGAVITVGVLTRYSIAPFNGYTAAVNFCCGVLLLSFAFLLKRNVSPKVLANGFLLILTIVGTSSAFGNGGVAAPAAIVFVLIPVLGFLLNGKKGGALGLAFTLSAVTLTWFAEQNGLTAPFANPQRYSTAKVFLISATSIGAYLLGYAYEKSRKFVENELTNREEQIRAILESSPVGNVLVDSTGQVLFLNRAAKSLMNAKDQSSGMKLSELLPESCRQQIQDELLRLSVEQKNEKTPLIEIQFSKGAEDISWARVQIVKLSAINGDARFLCTFTDITEQKRVEEMRFTMIANSKMAALGEMAGGVAHEINNPLSIIVGKCGTTRSLLRQPEIDREKVSQELEKIAATAGRIAKITTGLLAFSRSGEQDPPGNPTVQVLVEETIAFCIEKFKARNVRLDLDFSEIGNVHVKCRQSQISQVLLNLLNNAIDELETHSTSVQKWVQLKAAMAGNHVEFSVTDSGTGIPKEVLEKLFQPFFTTKPVGRGTGLGLSISKGLVESHGGKLLYDSNSPNTRFVVSLPLS